MFQTEGGPVIPGYIEAGNKFQAKVAWDKFDGMVRILVSMIRGTPELKLDIEFGKKMENLDAYSKANRFDALVAFEAVTDLFHRRGIFKPPIVTYGGHI